MALHLNHRTLISEEIEKESLPCAFKKVGIVREEASRHCQALSRVQRDFKIKLGDTKMNYSLSSSQNDGYHFL